MQLFVTNKPEQQVVVVPTSRATTTTVFPAANVALPVSALVTPSNHTPGDAGPKASAAYAGAAAPASGPADTPLPRRSAHVLTLAPLASAPSADASSQTDKDVVQSPGHGASAPPSHTYAYGQASHDEDVPAHVVTTPAGE